MTKNLQLTINPKLSFPLPYGLLALNGLLKPKATNLDVAVSHTLPAPGLKLDVLWDEAPMLQSESLFMRYLVRSEQDPTIKQQYYPSLESLDAVLDQCDALKTYNEVGVKAIYAMLLATKLQLPDQITVADFALWSLLKSSQYRDSSIQLEKDLKEFVSKMDALPCCSDALKVLNHALESSQNETAIEPALLKNVESKKAVKGGKVDNVPAAQVKQGKKVKATTAVVPPGSIEDLQKFAADNKPAKFDESCYNPEDPMNYFKLVIAHEIALLTGCGRDAVADMLELSKIAPIHDSELTLPIPKLQLKQYNAIKLTEYIYNNMPKKNKVIDEVSMHGCFLKFKINKKLLMDLMIQAIQQSNAKFGENKSMNGQTFIVEFSSPNIAKPFHAGHLRSTIIGNFIRNIARANGAKTVAINYLGDWGKQFGLLAVGFNKFGSEQELITNPIMHLYDVYVKTNKAAEEDPTIHDAARQYFKRMEEGEAEALGIWKRFRDLSIVKYKEIYARLFIEFDEYSGESQYGEGMKEIMNHLQSMNLLKESDGAVIVDLKQYKLPNIPVQKSDGTTLYITRDIAAAVDRHRQYDFDKMIYVVASQQDLHFRQLFKILDLAGFDKWAKKCEHISFGMVKGMSTRRGTVVFLEDILNDAKAVMYEKMQQNPDKFAKITNPEETAHIIGLSAVMVQDMSAKRVKDYDFDLDRMTSFEGDRGPYLQYAHSRLCSIERSFVNHYLANVLNRAPENELDISYSPQLPFSIDILHKADNPKMLELVFLLSQYPALVQSIPNRDFEPCNVIIYLFQICHKISSCLDDIYVMDTANVHEDKEVLLARFWIYWSARVVLGNGMRLLGLKPLERM